MIKTYWPFAFLFIFWLSFSFPFFFQNKVPYPSTHQVNAFSPWSRYSQYASPIKNDAMPDLIDQIYPWKYFAIEQLKKGVIPFWNPYSFAGTPHIANYQTAVFSPVTIFYFIFPFVDAWSLVVLLQPLLAGIGVYLYMRKVAVSIYGALTASIAFMFSGFMVVWMAYGTLGMAIAVLPFILYFIERFFEKKSFVSLLGISILLAFSFLSGHFQTSIYVFSLSFLYLAWKVFMTRAYKAGVWILFYFLLGLSLAMPQILPSLEFYQNAPRSATYTGSSGIPFYNVVTIIAPDFFGNPVTRNNLFKEYAEWQAFIGIVPFLLSFFALSLARKHPKSVFFIVIGIGALLLAVASPIQDLVTKLHIPVISTSTQSRIIIIFSFCFALLAGFGFDNVYAALKEKKYKTIFIKLIIVGFILGAIWIVLLFGNNLSFEQAQVAKKNFILPSIMFVTVILGIAVVAVTKKKYSFIFLSFLIIGLTAFDSLRFVTKWMPFDPKYLVFPEEKITEVIKKELGNGRVFGNIGQEMTMYYGLRTIGGYDPLYIQRYGEFITSSTTGNFTASGGRTVSVDKTSKNTDKVLHILGTQLIVHPIADTNAVWAYPVWEKQHMKHIYSDASYSIYRNTDAIPRAKMFYAYETIPQQEKSIQRFYHASFDYKNTLLLEEKSPIRPTKNTKNSVSFFVDEPNTVVLHVSTQYDGMLFLSDAYYPGWKAFVDGKQTKIFRANYAFRAVAIPPGSHTVTFSYMPQSFYMGSMIALIGSIALLTFFLFPKSFKR